MAPLPTTTPESFATRIGYVLLAVGYTLCMTATLAARTIFDLTPAFGARCDSANALASISASLASAARTNPGSELMIEVFRLAGPSVMLFDELVMLDNAR
jgi:hypothetical protein